MRRALILLGLLAVLAAGCGGGGDDGGGKPLSKEDYQAKLASTAKEIGDSIGSKQNDIDKMTDAQLEEFTSALHTFAKKLDAINPPDEVKTLHADLVKALDDLAAEFPGIAKQLKETKDPSAAITALFGAKGIQELIRLGNEFKKKGYDLDLNGTS